MKEKLIEIHRQEPASIKGIIANDLILKGDIQLFFDDFLGQSFDSHAAYKHRSFKFIRQNREQFQNQISNIITGDFSDYHIWKAFRIVISELEIEVKLYEK